MEPRPSHSGGSLSANAGAALAALISARGTSVWARRSIRLLGEAGVWQIGEPASGAAAVARAPASVAMFAVNSIAKAVPPRAAAPAETSSLCDRVNVAMLLLQRRAEKKICRIRDFDGLHGAGQGNRNADQ